MSDIDIMGYLPDPDEPIQVLPIVRDGAIWFQILDTESGQTFIVNYMSALKMAGRLAYLTGRITQDLLEADAEELGPTEWEAITRAMDDPTDERFQREEYRRPKN